MENGSSYPATLSITTPEKVDNWRPLVHWLLAIPHLIVVNVLNTVATVVAIIAWFVIVFTGRLGSGFSNLLSMYLRYENRAYAFAGFLTTKYPPFTFDTSPDEPGDYEPVEVNLEPEAEDRNRLTVGFRWILAIPHYIVLMFLGVAALVVWIIAFFAVLFTAKWPEGMRNFVLGYMRWNLRVNAYSLLLTDEYPPFSLD